MSTVLLENDDLRLLVDPKNGAGTLSLYGYSGHQWLPLMPDSQRADCDLACANFLMVPYSNRVENGAFVFGGQHYQLENGAQHAIHGDVRHRPWQISEQSATRLGCAWDSRQAERVNWPWPFAVAAEFALDGAQLTMRLTLRNEGDSPMPAGMGWHPYFNRTLTRTNEPVYLHFSLEGAYPDANETRIPSGPLQPLAPHQDFAQARMLEPDNFLDTCYYGFQGGRITWPESGIALRLDASQTCNHLIVYNPAGKSYFAVEPVTNANNGVNLLAQDDPTCGTAVLYPGAELAAECTLSLERM